MARFDLTDFECSMFQPLLPNKSRGVTRVDDRRVLNGIFWRLRTARQLRSRISFVPTPAACPDAENAFSGCLQNGLRQHFLEAANTLPAPNATLRDRQGRLHDRLPGSPKQRGSTWDPSAPPCLLDRGDVDFLHGHHRAERAFCFVAVGSHRLV